MLNNIRFYVLLFSFLLACGIFIWAKVTFPDTGTQIIKLTQTFALTAITFLYFTLLTSPLTRIFTFLPYRGKYLKARRALGVSAFFFGLLHGSFAFFGELGGFENLLNLSGRYLLAISLSFTALLILFLMAATATDYMVEKLSFPKWKMLHRLVYIASIFIIIHALLIGSHFQDSSNIVPKVSFPALLFLLILESIRFYRYLKTKFQAKQP